MSNTPAAYFWVQAWPMMRIDLNDPLPLNCINLCDYQLQITKRCDNRNNNIPVGTEPQHTSRVVVLARTNCTLVGAGGFSKEKRKSLQTYLRVMEINFKGRELLKWSWQKWNHIHTCFKIPQVFAAYLPKIMLLAFCLEIPLNKNLTLCEASTKNNLNN